jgi:ubiquinone/menaquinone biosynthesis C-methylase UbiE
MSSRDSDESGRTSIRDDRGAPVQEHVSAHFDSAASYWDAVYSDERLQGRIYRRRQQAVVDCIEAANLPAQACALEVGCGAGHLTLQLAAKGLRVQALDASQAMVDTTASRARDAGLGARVTVGVGDVHALPYEPNHFDLVVAVGVIPWLHSPGDAIREMARVLRPGGELILTADNAARLTSFTDPRELLALTPLKRIYHAVRKPRTRAMSRLDSPRRVDRLLREQGLRPVGGRTVGFGPFTFWRRGLFDEARSLRIDDRLQALTDRGAPGLRWTGWHYVVRATKIDLKDSRLNI